MKHNKKRNTAFIYETLTRELTQSIVEKDATRKQEIVSILKEYFTQGAPLAEELQLYRVLLETTNIQEKVAERLLTETKNAYQALNRKLIFDTQSEAIASINKKLGKKVWGVFVPNFKALASVNAIFNTTTSVKKKVLFEQALVDQMSARQVAPSQQMEPLDALAYKSFLGKFNEKYGTLLQEQKDLLNRVITSFADDGFELQVYLNEEISRLKQSVAAAKASTDTAAIESRLTGVATYLEELRRRELTDGDLKKILKTQELVKELSAHD